MLVTPLYIGHARCAAWNKTRFITRPPKAHAFGGFFALESHRARTNQ